MDSNEVMLLGNNRSESVDGSLLDQAMATKNKRLVAIIYFSVFSYFQVNKWKFYRCLKENSYLPDIFQSALKSLSII